ncbi:MAG: hypothetical protein JXP36_10085 [Bacteroidales bacterium]|nr:hypothetical protein [Bacteroidales bacterium]
MNELLNKLSSYNLFNYLFPGVLFVVLLKETTNINLIQGSIIEGVFLYYFIGLIISRIGSVLVEPVLMFFKFIKYTDPNDFKKADNLDSQIKLHLEINNMLRTLIALMFVWLIIVVTDTLGLKIDFKSEIVVILIITLLLVLFLFSFKKQTKFINRRIKFILKDENDTN